MMSGYETLTFLKPRAISREKRAPLPASVIAPTKSSPASRNDDKTIYIKIFTILLIRLKVEMTDAPHNSEKKTPRRTRPR